MGLIDKFEHPNVITVPADWIINWARKSSLFPLGFGIACCAIEMMHSFATRYDLDRFGVLMRATPRQSDVMIVAGPVTKRMVPVIKRLYAQMPEPKWIIAMGSCATSGGGFAESYNVIKGVDTILPVDVYVPGCPPKPEALINGFLKLREKILTETVVKGDGRHRQSAAEKP